LLVLQDIPECEHPRAEDPADQCAPSFPQAHYAPASP
jgi:hypothetical protein